MSASPNEKTAEHLMNLIVTRNGQVPNFSLLLGSGGSLTSGIQTAEDMIERWRRLLFYQSGSLDEYHQWVGNQNWYRREDEYSILFEEVYDEPAQRRVFVEECVKDAHPTWGYVYLTNLLSNHFFDVVFTTNFDDLINEASYLYSDGLRPMVAAHDSAIQGIRLTSGRPKIIKLHGDFLYDNIKNTLSELETLEGNTKRKLKQFAQEYGLVVIGYSGRDRSVMDTIELLLRDEENYKQGVYWCLRRGAAVSGRLESLLKRDRVYLVEIDGFDELMADLHKTAQLALPKSIAQPFEMARDRANLFVRVRESLQSHPVISAHIREVLRGINTNNPKLPLQFEAARLSSIGELGEAIPIWEQVYAEDPTDSIIAFRYADALADAGRYEELSKLVTEAPLAPYNKAYFFLRAGRNQEVIDLATAILADSASDESNLQLELTILRINRAIAFKRIGRAEDMMADLDVLDQDGSTAEAFTKAGVAALRGDKREMFSALKESLNKTISPKDLEGFPVFEDYREDPDFLKFIQSANDI